MKLCVFQNHLLSVFDNTRLVTFDEKVYDKILAINSQEGERVDLDEPVNAQVGLKRRYSCAVAVTVSLHPMLHTKMPIPELHAVTSCRKGWRRIFAEMFLMFSPPTPTPTPNLINGRRAEMNLIPFGIFI